MTNQKPADELKKLIQKQKERLVDLKADNNKLRKALEIIEEEEKKSKKK